MKEGICMELHDVVAVELLIVVSTSTEEWCFGDETAAFSAMKLEVVVGVLLEVC